MKIPVKVINQTPILKKPKINKVVMGPFSFRNEFDMRVYPNRGKEIDKYIIRLMENKLYEIIRG